MEKEPFYNPNKKVAYIPVIGRKKPKHVRFMRVIYRNEWSDGSDLLLGIIVKHNYVPTDESTYTIFTQDIKRKKK